jgi:uncharacterized protein
MNGEIPANVERKDFLGRGWAMPVELDPRTGLVQSVAYEEDIRQSILIILETVPGERVMRPNFGCGIHELVFEALDSTAIQRIKSAVEEAMRRCEARIEVIAVDVSDPATEAAAGPGSAWRDAKLSDSDGAALIELEYRVRKTNQTGNLVFPFYFREGGRP